MTNIDAMKVMYHPITGALLEPIGSRANGRPIWPIMGGSEAPPEGTNSGGSGSDSGAGGGGGGTDSGGNSGGGQGSGGTGDSGTGTEPATVSQDDFDALQKRMQAADQRAAKAEKDLQDIKDKDLDEKTRAEKERDDAKAALEAAQQVIKSLRLENAFLRDTTHTWHDPSDVLAFIERDERVTIDDDGKVQGLEAALKELATKKSYLVKKAEQDPLGPSGEPQGAGGGGGKDGKPERKDLIDHYPSLRGRTRTQSR